MRRGIVLDVASVAIVGAAVVVAARAPFGTPRSAAAGHWEIVDLGVLPGGSQTDAPASEPAAIDDDGTIVGTSWAAGGRDHAFVWRDGRLRDLGTLGGRHSAALDVASGVVAGWAEARSGRHRAVVWIHGRAHDLGALGFQNSEAHSVNASGTVVGVAFDTGTHGQTTRSRAVVWREGHGSLLPAVRGELWSDATAIDDSGALLGQVATAGGLRGVVWERGRVVDLGVLPGMESTEPEAIAPDGTILGRSTDGNGKDSAPVRSFVWQHGRRRDLGELPNLSTCYGNAINARDTAIGWCLGPSGKGAGFVWRAGHMHSIGDLAPDAIADDGRIAGHVAHGLRERGFVRSAHGLTWLPTLPGARAAAQVTNEPKVMNAQGEIAGIATTGRGTVDAVVWRYVR